MDGFGADLGQLRTHAEATKGIGERAVEAADAGRSVADMDDAYGILCRPIAWILKGPQDRTAEAIGACADALQAAGKKLGDAVDTYEGVDAQIEQAMNEILEDLDKPQTPAEPPGDRTNGQSEPDRQGGPSDQQGEQPGQRTPSDQQGERPDQPNDRQDEQPKRQDEQPERQGEQPERQGERSGA